MAINIGMRRGITFGGTFAKMDQPTTKSSLTRPRSAWITTKKGYGQEISDFMIQSKWSISRERIGESNDTKFNKQNFGSPNISIASPSYIVLQFHEK